MIFLGSQFPDFTAVTTQGTIKFYDWLGKDWGILFSHPRDYTPVCTTELARMVELYPEFEKRKVKVIALSCDTIEDHIGWSNDILHYCNKPGPIPYPIIDDKKRVLARKFGMLDADEKDEEGIPLTARAVFIIGPDKTMKLSILYPATTGRNFDEILRVVDSLKLTDVQPLATPVDWKPSSSCMLQPTLSQEDAQTRYPGYQVKDLPSGRKYLRTTTKY